MTSDPVAEFLEAFLVERGLDPALRTIPGASVVPDDDRAGTGVASGYVVGERFLIWCDPAVAESVARFDPPPGDAGSRLNAWTSFGTNIGAEYVGSGMNRVLGAAGVSAAGVAAVASHRSGIVAIDAAETVDAARLADFVEAADPDDLDEAEIEPDNHDPVIRCAEATPAGPLAAYASARPWEGNPRWWDIGVLTLPDSRGQGLGLACVVATTQALLADGRLPLYRHNADNEGSAALAARAGFDVAVELAAISITGAS